VNNPEKGSNPRIFALSDKLLRMLQVTKNTNTVKDKNRIFQLRLHHIRRQYQRTKVKIAKKLQNPRIEKIMLKTFRTWKATMLYHQTKDPWYVMEFLGHTTMQHTKKYVQLEKALFQGQSDEYVCKVAKTSEEAVELIELGFEYVNEINKAYLYRKRK
jgi:integrase